jgi:hypothetical protein
VPFSSGKYFRQKLRKVAQLLGPRGLEFIEQFGGQAAVFRRGVGEEGFNWNFSIRLDLSKRTFQIFSGDRAGF